MTHAAPRCDRTVAWTALSGHYEAHGRDLDLREAFARDPQRFELRPLPEPPKGGLGDDGKSLTLAWSGRAEDTQHVELARDPQFTQIVAQADLSTPEWTVPRPAQSGTYYFRYRSIEPDGFVGPYSSPLVIEVPRDWRFLWLLAPLLLAL